MIGHVVSWSKRLSLRFGQSDELRKLDPEGIDRIAGDFVTSVSAFSAKKWRRCAGASEAALAEILQFEGLLQNKHSKELGGFK